MPSKTTLQDALKRFRLPVDLSADLLKARATGKTSVEIATLRAISEQCSLWLYFWHEVHKRMERRLSILTAKDVTSKSKARLGTKDAI